MSTHASITHVTRRVERLEIGRGEDRELLRSELKSHHKEEQTYNNETRRKMVEEVGDRIAAKQNFLTKGQEEFMNDTRGIAYRAEAAVKMQAYTTNVLGLWQTRAANDIFNTHSTETIKKLQAEVSTLKKNQIKEQNETKETIKKLQAEDAQAEVSSLKIHIKEQDEKIEKIETANARLTASFKELLEEVAKLKHNKNTSVHNPTLSSHDGVADFKDPSWNKKRKWDADKVDPGCFDDAETPKLKSARS